MISYMAYLVDGEFGYPTGGYGIAITESRFFSQSSLSIMNLPMQHAEPANPQMSRAEGVLSLTSSRTLSGQDTARLAIRLNVLPTWVKLQKHGTLLWFTTSDTTRFQIASVMYLDSFQLNDGVVTMDFIDSFNIYMKIRNTQTLLPSGVTPESIIRPGQSYTKSSLADKLTRITSIWNGSGYSRSNWYMPTVQLSSSETQSYTTNLDNPTFKEVYDELLTPIDTPSPNVFPAYYARKMNSTGQVRQISRVSESSSGLVSLDSCYRWNASYAPPDDSYASLLYIGPSGTAISEWGTISKDADYMLGPQWSVEIGNDDPATNAVDVTAYLRNHGWLGWKVDITPAYPVDVYDSFVPLPPPVMPPNVNYLQYLNYSDAIGRSFSVPIPSSSPKSIISTQVLPCNSIDIDWFDPRNTVYHFGVDNPNYLRRASGLVAW